MGTFLAFSSANRLINDSKSNSLAISRSIEIVARPSSLSWLIVDLRYFFINFSFENDRSHCGTETGRKRSIRNDITTLGSAEEIPLSTMNFKAANGLVSGTLFVTR